MLSEYNTLEEIDLQCRSLSNVIACTYIYLTND